MTPSAIRDCDRVEESIRNGHRWRLTLGALVSVACLLSGPHLGAQTSLTSVEYPIRDTSLPVSPAALSVPKGITGSVLASLVAGGSTNNAGVARLAQGAYVQAILRGPGFPTPQRIVAAPNWPLMLPPIALVGDYELDNIALVDATTGKTRMDGTPSTVPVHVFDQDQTSLKGAVKLEESRRFNSLKRGAGPPPGE